ncbi:MAG: hypothetical protein E6I70_09800 [Chloroflexi bacterium]|nr:MAG: hypothetical protein E6I63_04855 [Chloroflexota bacterium]TME17771.1 MAG: hypothetical protein E6I70_09800 [Chloroflexota bacterium]
MSISSSQSGTSRRRGRRPGPAQEVQEAEAPWRLPDLPALLTLAVILALLMALGFGLWKAVEVKPAGPFAKCKTAAQLGPHLYAGPPAMCIDVNKTYMANLYTTRGTIGISMIAKDAPQTVNNFIVLGVNGYYNGLGFWRIEKWIIQGGDPSGDGTGGPGYTLPPEANSSAWAPGSVGMARDPSGPVNGSQFFFLKDAWPGSGPGGVVYNQFGTALIGFELVGQLNDSDRVLGFDVKLQS